MTSRIGWLVTVAVLVTLLVFLWPRGESLVVYCAHDAVYSEAILRQFERETGIPVSIRFDTEATKSLGLVNRLLSEKEIPQCDVFWNNELLGTMALAEAGVIEAYKGEGHARIPAPLKDPEGLWTGFAARFRVWIINRDRMPGELSQVEKHLTDVVFPEGSTTKPSLKGMAVAVPLYGTTLTHYSALWHAWGADRLKAWHTGALERGMHLDRNGNGGVMNRVASGQCDFGWTDTDDFFVARDEGRPVDLLPIRVEGKTLAIPNTVALVRGSRHPEAARKLIDYLLSERVELQLAKSKSRQVPLGPVDEASLPDDVRALRPWVADAADLRPLLTARNDCLDWLRKEALP